MCKLCTIATWHPRVRQDSLVFNLSQFATAVTANPLPKQPPDRDIQAQFDRRYYDS
ncbi:MAG: hypothetical protein HY785_05880 [Oscillatoriophycideae cyanobacterium NC_groundwater_1537_Pr4_S-0.65um_50_18]|nr:hypothetical protein [Oscillatoriophycideae cyanobacterium NC_groundwater_1537_Pr4_S-0.65um_50_18]